MRFRIPTLVIIVILGGSQAISAQDKPVDVGDYCALIDAADEYDGKRVTVFAIYSYGLGREELFCRECRVIGGITRVEFSLDHERQWKRQLRRAPKDIGVIAGRFTGLFRKRAPGDTYGGYGFELNVEQISDVRVLVRGYAVIRSTDLLRAGGRVPHPLSCKGGGFSYGDAPGKDSPLASPVR